VVLLVVPILVAIKFFRRRGQTSSLLLAASLPLAFVVLALGSEFNPWLGRFLIAPAAVTAPLLARLFIRRGAWIGYALVGVLSAGLALAHDSTKSLESGRPAPWNLSRVEAVAGSGMVDAARGVSELNRVVPNDACIGTVLGIEDPLYLLFGSNLGRRVVLLERAHPVADALRHGLHHVVISLSEARTVVERQAPGRFRAAGWTLRSLGSFWWIATPPSSARHTVERCS